MISVYPAYGRDYKSKAEVIEAFNANKDFIVADAFHRYCGAACNKSDLVAGNEGKVKIRYKKLANIVILDAVSGKEAK